MNYSFTVQAESAQEVLSQATAKLVDAVASAALQNLEKQLSHLRQPKADEVVFATMEGKVSLDVHDAPTIISTGCLVGVSGRPSSTPAP